MEVKPGYKQTDIGIIPEDWNVSPVSSFGETKRGASSLSIKYKSSGGKRLIRINDFFQDSPVFVEPTEDIMRFAINERDLLFAGTGASAGASYLPKKEWIGLPHSYNAPRIRVFEKNCKEYLLYSLKSDYVRKQQRAWFVGNAQPFLDTKAISSFSIATPPTLHEQEAIAKALSDADALIEAFEQLLTKKRQVKKGAMQELLTGKRRLPEFSKKWETKKLGDVFEITAGGDFDPIQSSDIQDERFPYPIYSNALTDKGLYGFSSYNNHQAGSITVTARGTLGAANYRNHDFTAIGRVIVLKPTQPLDGRFIAEFINHRIDFVIESTGVPQLTAPQISKYEILFPEFLEQTAIAEILSDMDAEIAALEGKLAKNRQVKQGMMQELLTGRVRLV